MSKDLPAPAAGSTLNSVQSGVRPLLAPALKHSSHLVSTVIRSPLQLSAPIISLPLLSPNLARTDVALNRVSSIGSATTAVTGAALTGARTERLASLFRAAPVLVDRDPAGQPIVRGRILLIDPSPATLRQLRASGFTVGLQHYDPTLRISVVTLGGPSGASTIDAMRRLRSIAPRSAADFDHLYEPAGGALEPSNSRAARPRSAGGPLVGMIDGGVAAHPSLVGRVAEQRGFAGAARPTGHGTAVASLLVGQDGAFRGSARGASLLVADVYGGNRSAGSASRIAQALGWLASRRPKVINISLVGPSNALLQRAVEAVRARGIPVVAAVGNDGPAAPPQYPASYRSVLAVTGVDSRGVALFESGNAIDLDFAAPGADMAAARPGRGYARVRGTSFAAALAAGRLTMLGSPERLAAEARPGKGRVGRGIVCFTCRVAPQAVRAN